MLNPNFNSKIAGDYVLRFYGFYAVMHYVWIKRKCVLQTVYAISSLKHLIVCKPRIKQARHSQFSFKVE